VTTRWTRAGCRSANIRPTMAPKPTPITDPRSLQPP
jgi:hypothetical protein